MSKLLCADGGGGRGAAMTEQVEAFNEGDHVMWQGDSGRVWRVEILWADGTATCIPVSGAGPLTDGAAARFRLSECRKRGDL
jgi:hypothetical protein